MVLGHELRFVLEHPGSLFQVLELILFHIFHFLEHFLPLVRNTYFFYLSTFLSHKNLLFGTPRCKKFIFEPSCLILVCSNLNRISLPTFMSMCPENFKFVSEFPPNLPFPEKLDFSPKISNTNKVQKTKINSFRIDFSGRVTCLHLKDQRNFYLKQEHFPETPIRQVRLS